MMFKGVNRCQAQLSAVAITKSNFEDAAEQLLLVDENNFNQDLGMIQKLEKVFLEGNIPLQALSRNKILSKFQLFSIIAFNYYFF